ncbi:MAG: hypothetical protein R2827_01765 [Bdellovibrionales bacterium]
MRLFAIATILIFSEIVLAAAGGDPHHVPTGFITKQALHFLACGCSRNYYKKMLLLSFPEEEFLSNEKGRACKGRSRGT